MSIKDKLEACIVALEEAKADAEKFDKGMTGAPGTRVRKVAMDSKKALDDVRKAVLEGRK